jgi:hypothetical protein
VAPRALPGPWRIWRLALGLVRRHWIVLGTAGLSMGAATQLIELLPVDNTLDNVIEVVVSTYVYFLFLVFVEVVVERDSRAERLSAGHGLVLAGRIVLTAVPVALVGTALLSAAAVLSVLLVLPGLWFLTRIALTVPAMVVERHGASRGLLRSVELTARRFWLTFLTAGIALILDELIDAEVAIVTTSPLEEGDWATWVLGGLVSTVVVIVTAPVVSMAFQTLAAAGPVVPRRGELRRR